MIVQKMSILSPTQGTQTTAPEEQMVPEARQSPASKLQDKGQVSRRTLPCVASDQTIIRKAVGVTHRPDLGNELGTEQSSLGWGA